jgi:GNAT superfamily N-acetyltransferase
LKLRNSTLANRSDDHLPYTAEVREFPPRPRTLSCLRSKAVWGYSGDFMRACRNELSLTPDDIRASHVQVAESKDQILGVAQLTVKESLAELDKLFVEPAVLRSGAGRMLFEWARLTAREAGATVLRIDADRMPPGSTGAWAPSMTAWSPPARSQAA